MTYYGFALNDEHHIEQVLVTQENRRQVSQVWTGVLYHSMREAYRDMVRLNCQE